MEDSVGPTYENLWAMFQRLTERQDLPEDARNETLEELSVLIEELTQADEELRVQNEDLVAARRELDDERKRYQELFDFAPDAYLVTDPQGTIEKANRAAAEMFRVRKHFLIGKPLNLFIKRDEWKSFFALLRENPGNNSRVPHIYEEIEIGIQPRDGPPVVAAVTFTPMLDSNNRQVGLRWLLRDVTRRKQVEEELEEMRRRLQGSGEAERMLLAREIHDGPMQDLYGIMFKLNMTKALTDETPLKNDLVEVENAIKGVAGNLRSICGELRPPTLANLGLERAIRSHAENLQEQHPDLKIHLNLMSDMDLLPQELRLALFRVYQQAISNVLRHAQASEVKVDFDLEEEQISLVVRDNGVGFKPPSKWVDPLRRGHFGLAGMAERVQAFGGELIVNSSPGEGAEVQAFIPLPLQFMGQE